MIFDFDWKIYTALAFVFFLMALPMLHRRFYGQVAEKNPNDLLAPNHNYRLIDLRSEKDFQASHIEQAINIPCSNTAQCKQKIFDLLSSTNLEQSTVLICDTDLVSTKMAKKLRDMGCNNVFMLKGGLNYWKRKQLPLSKDVK